MCQARGSQVLCRFGAGPHISLCLLQVADEAWAAEQRSLHQLQQLQEERDAGKARLEQVEAQLRQVRWRLGTSNAGLLICPPTSGVSRRCLTRPAACKGIQSRPVKRLEHASQQWLFVRSSALRMFAVSWHRLSIQRCHQQLQTTAEEIFPRQPN